MSASDDRAPAHGGAPAAGRAPAAGEVADGLAIHHPPGGNPPTGGGVVVDGELLAFSCPRCGGAVRETYYGPCRECRDALRATVGAEAQDVAVAAFEPKMNVTPNAVATKD